MGVPLQVQCSEIVQCNFRGLGVDLSLSHVPP